MSPEQARGQKVDARTDLFSLGIVLFELVAGKPPFEGDSPVDVIGAILVHKPVPLPSLRPEVPARLDQIIQRTLCKEREQRYPSAQALLRDLKECQSELQLESHLAKRAAAPKTASTGKPLWLVPASLSLVLLLAGGLYFSRGRADNQFLTTEFSEFFLDLGRWTVPASGWSIRGERLAIENQTTVGYPTRIQAGDFTMTFHLKLENAEGAAWALRIRDPDNYYLFYLDGTNNSKNATNYFSSYIVRAGKLGVAVSRIPVTTKLLVGGEYTINVTAKHNEITHLINSAEAPSQDPLGDPLGYFKDEENTYQSGGFGFRTIGQERFSVDELYVRPLSLRQ
jgi:hypothetical protein